MLVGYLCLFLLGLILGVIAYLNLSYIPKLVLAYIGFCCLAIMFTDFRYN